MRLSRSPRLTLAPIPALLIAVTSVQGGAALAKSLFPGLGPSGASGVRLGFAAILLLAFFRPSLARLTKAHWRAVVPYGLALGGMNLAFYESIARIPLGLAVTLEFAGPLGVALYGSRRAIDFAWVLLAGAGIVLLGPWQSGVEALDPIGAALALLAGAFWAAYIVMGGRVSRVLSEGESVSVGMLIATAVVLPFALADGVVSRMTPSLFGMGILVAILASALPYTLEMIALRALPGRTFGILMSLEPVVATVAGFMFLSETLSAPQWLAVLCVCGASAGATWSARGSAARLEAEG